MAFDFAARPPEINSGLMYSGSGAGPMMAASSAFSALSSELSSNAASYESIISSLGSQWTGPSSTAMAASAQTYTTWLTTTSAQLQDAAAAATSSAAAYEAAYSATIPPAVVAANRAQLAVLVATNILGQNTPAIAANEAMYGEFWAQDAAAMYGYSAAASTASSALTPLTDPTENTTPGAQGAQASAVSNAAGTNGASAAQNQAVSGLQNAASAAAQPAAVDTPMSVLSALNGLIGQPIVENVVYNIGVTLAWNIAMMTATLPLLGHFLAGAPFGVVIGDTAPLGAGLGFGTTLAGATGPAGGAAMMAGMGEASAVGGLSVPAGWSAAAPAAVTDATLTGSGWTAAVDEGAGMGGAPGGIMPGMASAGGKSGYGMAGPRYGVKPKVMPKQVFV
ncbi:MAG TPA: PPE family protein [Mycobacterium sp.]|uniref:PPE family protein n=1 Tax=Mycobacterium sp. TaxID=1785 RepID=UPI002CF8EA07|nr:PPE family protein [Mycobacterium sp.]HME77964.1 PPE family protein [Mycobacterium sp.]